MSTAVVSADNASGVHLPSDDHAAIPVDTSRTSVGVDVSAVADVSLPPMPDVAMPAPIDDLSFHAESSIAEPPSVAAPEDFGDDTAFNETLQSAAADITLFAVSLSSLLQTGHLPGKCGKIRELESDLGKVTEIGSSRAKCVPACLWYVSACNVKGTESPRELGEFDGDSMSPYAVIKQHYLLTVSRNRNFLTKKFNVVVKACGTCVESPVDRFGTYH